MTKHRVWDPIVRLFHWSLVLLFTANALFTDPEEKPHEIVGYVILGLLAVRILWGFVGSRHARFADFWPSPSAVTEQVRDMLAGRRTIHIGHTPLGALMIFNLIATLAAIGGTGYMMTTVTFFGAEWVEETHEILATWAEISVALHIAAVIWESRRTGVNLPKAMVSGVKSLPSDARLRS